MQYYQSFFKFTNILLSFLSKHLFSAQQFLIFLFGFGNQKIPTIFQIKCIIDEGSIHWLFIHLHGPKLLDNITDSKLHHHAHCFNLSDLIKNRLKFFDICRVFLQSIYEILDNFFGCQKIFGSDFSPNNTVSLHPTVSLGLKCMNYGLKSHWEKKWNLLTRHVFVYLTLQLVWIHFGLQVFERNRRVFVF